ncbi:MAG TPA: Ldh family oxidoreductase [Alphaproteobacteria bacterium]|nr:Ldh family oxidoreductase [Alphaproteobacteria bacterium]
MLNTRTCRIDVATLRQFMENILGAVGCDVATARVLAEVHLEADLRGIGVQGLNHLINSHVAKLKSGKEKPNVKPNLVHDRDAIAVIDGQSGPGPIAALFAAELAAQKAHKTGCAAVGVRNSHDLYMAGYYAERIARMGAIGFVFSDDVIPVVHPVGGAEPAIGSNPMAIAVPSEGEPFLIDFAPCATLPTYVRYTKRYGGRLPEGVAHDALGRPTTDPYSVSDGSALQRGLGAIAPLGNKGYGLLLAIDFLSGALMGCDMGSDHASKPKVTKGHLFVAIDPAAFGDPRHFRQAVSARIGAIKGSRKATDTDEIRVPGERSFACRARNLRDGRVNIDAICWEDALKLAKELDLEAPAATT